MYEKQRKQVKRTETDIPVPITLWIDSTDLSEAQIEYLKKFVRLEYDNAYFFEAHGNCGEYEHVNDKTNLDEEPPLFGLLEVVN